MKSLLNDDTIALRAVEPEDLDVLYRWENDTELWTVGNSIAPYSRKMLWDYIENYTADIYGMKQLRLMIILKETGAPVGTLDLFEFDQHNRRVGIGILIDKQHSRHGYGLRALTLATKYAEHHIGVHQIWATIPIDNTSSLALFQKCGYKICGRLRSWLRRGKGYQDVYMLQLLIN